MSIRAAIIVFALMGIFLNGFALEPEATAEEPAAVEAKAEPVDYTPLYFEDDENPDMCDVICMILTKHDVNWIASVTRERTLISVPADQLERAKQVLRKNKVLDDLVFQGEKVR